MSEKSNLGRLVRQSALRVDQLNFRQAWQSPGKMSAVDQRISATSGLSALEPERRANRQGILTFAEEDKPLKPLKTG